MGNHFRCIGFPVESPEQLTTLAGMVSQAGTKLENDECSYVVAGLPDGSQLWVQLNKTDDILGCVPHFQGESSMRVRVGGARQGIETPLDGSLLLWACPEQAEQGGMGLFPFMVDVPDFCSTALRLPIGTLANIQIAAFADDLHCFADEAQMRAQDGPFSGFAARSFIPSGLIQPDGTAKTPPEATGIFTGVVVSGERLANPVTHAEFLHLVVDTLGGQVDVVADSQGTHGEPVVGGVILGQFWLSGRVTQIVAT